VEVAKDRITNNMLSFIFDPGRLPGAALIEAEVAAALAHVKGSPPAEAGQPVLVAGEPELAARSARMRSGIAVEWATWEELRGAATSVGVILEEP
jgi:uncharacterized oxidoreductase